jgi:hypothetical protein
MKLAKIPLAIRSNTTRTSGENPERPNQSRELPYIASSHLSIDTKKHILSIDFF